MGKKKRTFFFSFEIRSAKDLSSGMANASISPLTRSAKEDEVSFETGHVDAVHDAQLDYYGKRLATSSSDRTIRVFDVSGGKHVLLAKLEGHEGPVWRVSWSHPNQGSLIVSCSFDATAIVWKEVSSGRWEKVRHVVDIFTVQRKERHGRTGMDTHEIGRMDVVSRGKGLETKRNGKKSALLHRSRDLHFPPFASYETLTEEHS